MGSHTNNIWRVLNNLPEPMDGLEQPLCPEGSDDANARPECHQLCVGTDSHHVPIPVLPTLLALLIIQIGLLTSMFLVPEFHETLPTSTNSFSVLQYIYVISWALIAILSWTLYNEFYEIWVLGYHSFHSSTQHLHTASFFIYTGGMVMMCIIGTAVRDYCVGGATNECGNHVKLSPVNYQQIVVVLLTILAVIFTVKLIGEVYRFNQSELPADVLVDDLGVRLSQNTLYIGIGKPSTIRTVMEVQGATIGSLQNRIDSLNRQVAILANTLEEHLTPSVTIQHVE